MDRTFILVDLIKRYEVHLSRLLHDIPEYDHMHWHPRTIKHYTNFDLVNELDLVTEFELL